MKYARGLFFFAALGLFLHPSSPVAQEAPRSEGWDDPRALELVRRAEERRSATLVDTALSSYQADARGYVYFYLDRRDMGERTLVKTDQVALDVYWKAPAFTKQRIIGLRDEKKLPTNINYHLDHLSVVQDNFGDRIRLGDGDEVRDVLHPAAPGAESSYHFRLADSLAIRLPGTAEPVRVYEVQVRPRDMGQPAFLGSIFVDQRRGDLVRMDFTFTPASYVDRYLDYINVSLDNGLWKERFWLPNQQRIEIRRQLPELDFPAGGVIRGTMRVSNYRFNQDLPETLFRGPKVVAVPPAERKRFHFEQDLYEEIREEGIGPETELAEIRKQAVELARARMLSGLPNLRLSAPAASAVVRYNRAEGVALGAGMTFRPAETVELRVRGGYAFGAGHPLAAAELGWEGVKASAYLNNPRDVGLGPVASGVLNTLSSLLAGEDYTDLYYASGVGLRAERALSPGWMLSAGVRAERHRSAELASDFSLFGGTFRPVRRIDEGTMLGGGITVRRTPASDAARAWGIGMSLEVGRLSNDGGDILTTLPYARPLADAEWTRRWNPRDAMLEVEGAAGFALGDLPRQELFLLGGRGTLPGYAFRSFAGDRFAMARTTYSADLTSPWLRGRVFGAAGWTGSGEAGEWALGSWGTPAPAGVKTGIGVGVGLFYDILRVDLARGLGSGGRWELIVETRPSFWNFL
jgi:hypothetical protein